MPTTIKVNVQDITPSWINQLQDSHANAMLEIKVHDKGKLDRIDDTTFWELINLLDWKKGENNDAIIAPVVNKLQLFSIEAIFQFQDILAQKLYDLDQQVFAENIGSQRYGGDRHFSGDSFLYARAAVVANGQAFYESVLNTPSKMPKEFTFESLLYIAAEAFKQKTGEDWSYMSKPSYETFTNTSAWGGKSWMDSILNL